MKIMPAATGTEKYKEGPRATPVKGKWRKKKGRKKKGACKHTSVEEEMRAGSNGDGKPQRDGRKDRGEEGRGENRRLKGRALTETRTMNVARIATRQRQGGRWRRAEVGQSSFEGKCVQRTRWKRGRRQREKEKKR